MFIQSLRRATDSPPSVTSYRPHIIGEEKGGKMNIYVGNLSLNVTDEELRHEFMAFGEVLSVTIMNDRYIGSGQPKGYGFVEMPSKSQGEAAIAGLNGKTLKNRAIDVIGALPLSDRILNNPYSKRSSRQFTSRARYRRS
jgi:RNA recognition motif-containing protein